MSKTVSAQRFCSLLFTSSRVRSTQARKLTRAAEESKVHLDSMFVMHLEICEAWPSQFDQAQATSARPSGGRRGKAESWSIHGEWASLWPDNIRECSGPKLCFPKNRITVFTRSWSEIKENETECKRGVFHKSQRLFFFLLFFLLLHREQQRVTTSRYECVKCVTAKTLLRTLFWTSERLVRGGVVFSFCCR